MEMLGATTTDLGATCVRPLLLRCSTAFMVPESNVYGSAPQPVVGVRGDGLTAEFCGSDRTSRFVAFVALAVLSNADNVKPKDLATGPSTFFTCCLPSSTKL